MEGRVTRMEVVVRVREVEARVVAEMAAEARVAAKVEVGRVVVVMAVEAKVEVGKAVVREVVG